MLYILHLTDNVFDVFQLERFPGKLQTTQNGQESANQANAQNKSYANAMKAAVKKDKEPSSVTNDNDSRLLLSK